jgi:hypothetical protein
MFTQSVFEASATQTIQVSRIDRWCIHQRLQELTIPCWCLDDGSLQVTVNSALTAMLVRSVVQQFVASRRELVNWLERCWQAEE